jgi:hypothetical protein
MLFQVSHRGCARVISVYGQGQRGTQLLEVSSINSGQLPAHSEVVVQFCYGWDAWNHVSLGDAWPHLFSVAIKEDISAQTWPFLLVKYFFYLIFISFYF